MGELTVAVAVGIHDIGQLTWLTLGRGARQDGAVAGRAVEQLVVQRSRAGAFGCREHRVGVEGAVGRLDGTLAAGIHAFWLDAQNVTDVSNPVVEDLRREVSEIRDEMRRLRERDAERQAWEASIVKRLPMNLH